MESTIPGGVIDSDTVFGSTEKDARLEESAELCETELTDGDCVNGIGSKLVSKDSNGKDSDREDLWFRVRVGVCVDSSLCKEDFSASRSVVEVWDWE